MQEVYSQLTFYLSPGTKTVISLDSRNRDDMVWKLLKQLRETMINRLKKFSFRKNLRKTITMEFFFDPARVLCLRYNNNEMTFARFWQKIPEAEKICYRVNEEFSLQFPALYEELQLTSKDWKETFLKFVNAHLNRRDRILDIFIRSNGEIIIHLEE